MCQSVTLVRRPRGRPEGAVRGRAGRRCSTSSRTAPRCSTTSSRSTAAASTDAPRPECCPAPFDVDNNWMLEYPTAYVIPRGAGQRSDPEATRLVEWLLFNDVKVDRAQAGLRVRGPDVREGLLRRLDEPGAPRPRRHGAAHRRRRLRPDLASSTRRPPHGATATCGAPTSSTIPQRRDVRAARERGHAPTSCPAASSRARRPLRAQARLADGGPDAEPPDRRRRRGASVALGEFDVRDRATLAAGSASSRPIPRRGTRSAATGRDAGLTFRRVAAAALPALEPIERVPRIAVLTGRSTRTSGRCATSASRPTRCRPRRSTRARGSARRLRPRLQHGRLAERGEPDGARAADRVLRARRGISRRRCERSQLPRQRAPR